MTRQPPRIDAVRRSRGCRRALLAIPTLLLVAAELSGQEYAASQRGTFKVTTDAVNPDIPAAQVRAGLEAADTLLAILKKAELFRNPVGVNVSAWREVNLDRGRWQTGRPYYYSVGATISQLVWKRDANGTRSLEEGPVTRVMIRVNGIPCAPIDNDGVEPDSGPPVSESRDNGARITGSFRGHAVYDGECLFMVRGTGSPIAPLTKERYMRLEILRLQGRLAGNRASMTDEAEHRPSDENKAMLTEKAPTMDCAPFIAALGGDAAGKKKAMEQCKEANATIAKQWKASQAEMREGASASDSGIHAARVLADTGGKSVVRRLQAELASMSPAERRKQASVVTSIDGERLVDVDSAGSLPLIQLNPRFFDSSLPATVPQVISIEIAGLQDGVTPFGYGEGTEDATRRVFAIGARLRDQLDWSAIETLVRKTTLK